MAPCLRCNRPRYRRGKKPPDQARDGRRVDVARAGSRGLCQSCETVTRITGDIVDYPTVSCVKKEDFLEDREFLLSQGKTEREVCAKFGYTWDTYTRKLYRAGVRRALER